MHGRENIHFLSDLKDILFMDRQVAIFGLRLLARAKLCIKQSITEKIS